MHRCFSWARASGPALLAIALLPGLARAAERLAHPRQQRDRLEGEVLEFHQRVRAGYRALAAREPERVVILDATLGILELEAQIRRHVERRLGVEAPGPAAESPVR